MQGELKSALDAGAIKGLKDAMHMPLAGFPISEAGKAFLTDVADQLLALEKDARRKRGVNDRENFIRAVWAITIDLLKAATRSADAVKSAAYGWAYHSSRYEYFKGAEHGVKAGQFVQAIRAMESAGFLQRAAHRRFKASAFGYFEGVTARYRAAEALLALAKTHGIPITPYTVGTHFKYGLPKTVVELREPVEWRFGAAGRNRIEGAKIPIPETEETAFIAAQVRSLNEGLQARAIAGGWHYAFKRVFNDGDPARPVLSRGGRLYSIGPSNYQHDSKEKRSEITIDGVRTREIDIRACFLTILYGLFHDEGFSMPIGDLYTVAGHDREVGKTWFKVAIGSGAIPEQWSKDVVKAFRDDTKGRNLRKHDIADVTRKMLEKHPVIRHALEGFKLNSKILMRVESWIVVETLVRLQNEFGIPALPVHDSLIVKEPDVATAVGVLKARFYAWLKIMPRLSVSNGPNLGFDLDAVEPIWPKEGKPKTGDASDF